MKIGIGSNIKEGQKCFYNNHKDIVAAECNIDGVLSVSIILIESGKRITNVSHEYECYETKEDALIDASDNQERLIY